MAALTGVTGPDAGQQPRHHNTPSASADLAITGDRRRDVCHTRRVGDHTITASNAGPEQR